MHDDVYMCTDMSHQLDWYIAGLSLQFLVQAERIAKLSDLTKHERELQDIQNQLEQYAESDPDKIKALSMLLFGSSDMLPSLHQHAFIAVACLLTVNRQICCHIL